jgi:site-specific recombinase XerD
MSYIQQAISSITEFGQRYEKFSRELIVRQYSGRTTTSYTSKIAELSLHFGKLPELLSEEEIRTYLSELLKRIPVPCKSKFEHTIASLRCYYKVMGFQSQRMHLPRVKHQQKLPVVLSEKEIEKLLHGTENLREKALLSMLYSCGLRVNELCSMEIGAIDSSRMTVCIRQGKGKKDRYVPLAHKILPLLRCYYKKYRPVKYLFNGNPGSPIKQRELARILDKNCRLTGIHKQITCHSLRHSYATHLLEMGENLLRIKQLLGHSYLRTTLVYLHIVTLENGRGFSPLDKLFNARQR